MNFKQPEWWKNGVIYQIYSLSFADGNGDGKGDLVGIAQRLDYLNDGNPDSQSSLGIDAIWITPVNKSPMVDNGYDISDYYDICPVFGTLADFDTLLEKAHQRGVKIIFDLVINHTSDRHDWFLESCSSRDNPKSNWYLWQDPNSDEEPPNNWRSYFGGSGWTFNDQRQQYYFHSFNQNQPHPREMVPARRCNGMTQRRQDLALVKTFNLGCPFMTTMPKTMLRLNSKIKTRY